MGDDIQGAGPLPPVAEVKHSSPFPPGFLITCLVILVLLITGSIATWYFAGTTIKRVTSKVTSAGKQVAAVQRALAKEYPAQGYGFEWSSSGTTRRLKVRLTNPVFAKNADVDMRATAHAIAKLVLSKIGDDYKPTEITIVFEKSVSLGIVGSSQSESYPFSVADLEQETEDGEQDATAERVGGEGQKEERR